MEGAFVLPQVNHLVFQVFATAEIVNQETPQPFSETDQCVRDCRQNSQPFSF